jgi:tetratricopeptide (TPR) repeat protein
MPEKSLQEIPLALRQHFEKGATALQRENFDYAIAIFNEILAKEPGFFECREFLRVTQFKKMGGGGGFFKKVFGGASSSPMIAKGQMALRNNPLEALTIAESILNGDPQNVGAHRLLAEAALAADLPRTAIFSLEILLKNASKDKGLRLQLARALGRSGEATRAEGVLAEVLRDHPNDGEVAMELKNLSARKTLDEGGYESLADGQGSYRDILKNKEEAVSLEQEKREVKSDDVAGRMIREYEARLAKEPNNLKVLRSLAELHAQRKDFDRALGYYEKIQSSGAGGDSSLERAIADTVIKKFSHALAQLDAAAPDHAERTAQIQAERQAFQITECQQRAEKYPTDLQIRFELGQLYFQAGKISEAIQELQKAQANPNRRVQAMGYLGQCFARRGMNDLAARTLQNAIKEKAVFDAEKKDLIYALGGVLEKMGKAEEAIEQFKLIYEVDIGYKDVAAKVDKYYAGQ